MKLAPLIRSAVLFMVLLGIASVVEADSIIYRVSGIASGTIGGSTFTGALVQVIAQGDTADVISMSMPNFGTFFVNPDIVTRVMIPGIGIAKITEPSAIYSSSGPITLTKGGFPTLPYVVIGTLDNPPSLLSFTGIGVLGSDALLGYDLQTSIGPITAIPGGVGYPVFMSIPTTLGTLSFTANIQPDFQGTFRARVISPATVPEPPPVVLLLSALGLVAVWRTMALKLTAGRGTNR
jgi:hypothetical protein